MTQNLIDFQTQKAQFSGLQLARYQEQIDNYNGKIDSEHQKLFILNARIEKQVEELEQKRIFQTEKSRKCDDDPINLNRKSRAFQFKLDGVKQKQNGIEAENRHLREEINKLRQERTIFQKMSEKLKQQLIDKKDDMIRIINESNCAKQFVEKINQELIEQQMYKQEAQQILQKQSNIVFQKDDIKTFRIINQDKITQLNKDTQNYKSPILETKFTMGQDDHQAEKQRSKDRRVLFQQDERHIKLLQHQLTESQIILDQLLVETASSTMEEVIQVFVQKEQEKQVIFQNLAKLEEFLQSLQNRKNELMFELQILQDIPKENQLKTYQFEKSNEQISIAQQNKQHIMKKLNDQTQIWKTLWQEIPFLLQQLKQQQIQYCGRENLIQIQNVDMNDATKVLSHMENIAQKIAEQHYQQQSKSIMQIRNMNCLLNESQESSFKTVQQNPNEDLNRILDKLQEEFRFNLQKKEPKGRKNDLSPVNLEMQKFQTYSKLRIQAEKVMENKSVKQFQKLKITERK